MRTLRTSSTSRIKYSSWIHCCLTFLCIYTQPILLHQFLPQKLKKPRLCRRSSSLRNETQWNHSNVLFLYVTGALEVVEPMLKSNLRISSPGFWPVRKWNFKTTDYGQDALGTGTRHAASLPRCAVALFFAVGKAQVRRYQKVLKS